jgi:lysine biosynthesis protein LysW
MSALCVECDSDLNIFGRVRLGQRIVCPNCGTTLEVISTHPIEVDVAYDEGEELGAADRFSLDEEDYDEVDGFDAFADEIDEDELIALGSLDDEGEDEPIDEQSLEDENPA